MEFIDNKSFHFVGEEDLYLFGEHVKYINEHLYHNGELV